MKDLVQLTIDYYDGKTESMVVTKESNAYMTMLEYAKQNDYAIDEKPYYEPLEINAIQVALDHLIEFLNDTMSDAIANGEESKHCEKLEATKRAKEKLA
tara:strand:+ start:206 stop:502 length:297 start_codon:yes stop_codon:yes gene_type:complete